MTADYISMEIVIQFDIFTVLGGAAADGTQSFSHMNMTL